MCAAQWGYLAIVAFLLQHEAAVNCQAVNGSRALTVAAGNGHFDVVRLLLEHGADPDLAGFNDCSPTLIAVDSGRADIVKLFLDHKASIDAQDNDGDTALHECAYENQLDCARILLAMEQFQTCKVAGFTPLMISAQLGKADLAEVEATENSGRTAMLLAAEEGYDEVVQALLNHGAAIETTDENGQTALMKAAYRGHEEVLRILLENGANAAVTDNAKRTASNYARLNNRIDADRVITDYLLEHPIDKNSELLSKPSVTHKIPEWFLPSREIRKEKDPFSFGSFGKVYRGRWLNSKVVVKCVMAESEKEEQAFHREARIWHLARHPNILPFFGASDESKPYFFVCEEATNGNLMDYLYRLKVDGRSLVWRKLHEAALGLLFLHERGIIHSDLKCNQILVSKDGAAMLTDFGLSFDSADARGASETLGAVRWKAPEVIRKIDPSMPTLQSDVYSFGMCIVEAVTGQVPWGDLPDPVVKFHHFAQEELIQERIAEYNEETLSELRL
ncbi:Ankyrin repeat-containing domain [Phytophthora cactorum]|nr:Ankyrin repeat-containing domain [Phytophthora cactorum]